MREMGRTNTMARRRARGAAMVEAVIVIVFLVFLWQLCWLVLNHYQAKQHASQLARQGAWQWAMRNACKDPKPEIPDGSGSTKANPPDPEDLTPPIKSGADEENMGDPNDASIPDTAILGSAIEDGNLATYEVDRPYTTSLSPSVQSVRSSMTVECNPEVKHNIRGAIDGLMGSLWNKSKPSGE